MVIAWVVAKLRISIVTDHTVVVLNETESGLWRVECDYNKAKDGDNHRSMIKGGSTYSANVTRRIGHL